MRPSQANLVRLLPRRNLKLEEKKIILPPPPQTLDLQKPTVIDLLKQQQTAAGNLWPSNIRIEPSIRKEAFKHVQSDLRTRLKSLLKER